mgnify:CR=1 FL=1
MGSPAPARVTAHARARLPPRDRSLPHSTASLCDTSRMPVTPREVRRIVSCVAFSGAALLLMTACSSEPEATPATATQPSREAGNLGTRVCIVNNTSLEASVAFTKKDTAQEGSIPAGGRLCGEGTFGIGNDVKGTVRWASPAWETGFYASNPWMGSPVAHVSENTTANKLRCAGKGFDVNESITTDNGIVQLTITRLADDQWKEFDFIFSPSANPSPDGVPMTGPGYRDCSSSPAKVS